MLLLLNAGAQSPVIPVKRNCILFHCKLHTVLKDGKHVL